MDTKGILDRFLIPILGKTKGPIYAVIADAPRIGQTKIRKKLEVRYKKTITPSNISKRCAELELKGWIKKENTIYPRYVVNTKKLEEAIEAFSTLHQRVNEALKDASFFLISHLRSIFPLVRGIRTRRDGVQIGH